MRSAFTGLLAAASTARVSSLAVITAKTVLGDRVQISSTASVYGEALAVCMPHSVLASGVRLFTSADALNGSRVPSPTIHRSRIGRVSGATTRTVRDVVVGAHCVVGANSVVMPGVTLGTGACVGANSFVPAHATLLPWSIYVGSPVRLVGTRHKDAVEALTRQLEATTPPCNDVLVWTTDWGWQDVPQATRWLVCPSHQVAQFVSRGFFVVATFTHHVVMARE